MTVAVLPTPRKISAGVISAPPPIPVRPTTMPTRTEVSAAAGVAAHLLRTIADDYADAADLLRASRDLATAVPT